MQKTIPWLFLYGDLGVGKTTFTKEVLSALNFDATEIQSPTFLKVLTYKSKAKQKIQSALHMDAYRIDESKEFLRLGLENLGEVDIGFVEWPERFESFLVEYPIFKETLEVESILRIKLPL